MINAHINALELLVDTADAVEPLAQGNDTIEEQDIPGDSENNVDFGTQHLITNFLLRKQTTP